MTHGNTGNALALKWTPEQDAMLVKRHTDGKLAKHRKDRVSSSKIADELNREFKTVYTRNAVIGRLQRLGLCEPIAEKRILDRIKKAALPAPPRRRDRADHIRTPTPPRAPADMPPLRCVEVVPRNIGLIDLEPGDCRWPYGDNIPFSYCGHPKHGRSSYCARHESLSGRA